VDDFLSYAVQQDPRWLGIAELAGIAAEQVEAARRRIEPDRMKHAALRTLFEDFDLVPV
jgi:hypothetical protein